MSKLIVTTRQCITHEVPARPGRSIMEILRDNGIGEILAMCGGCCSCATCHVIVDPAWYARLPLIGEYEDDLLEGSVYRTLTSRLSCQIQFSAELDGLALRVAPEE